VERDAGQLQTVARAVLVPPFRFLWRLTTEGLDNLPESGGAVIAPNHVSVLDSFFVPLVLPRRITYVGKSEYMESWKTKYLFPAMGMIPIDRSGGDSSKRALDAAARVLDSGELFGIYPEGTRSRDGQLHKGHTGLARLALRTGVPIVPVGIIGSREIQPPDAQWPKPFKRVHIRFGRPIDVARYQDRANDRLVLRQITDEVVFEIANLTGQPYVDQYASSASTPASTDTPVPAAASHQIAPVIPFREHITVSASEHSEAAEAAANVQSLEPAVLVSAAAEPRAAGRANLRSKRNRTHGNDGENDDGVSRRSSAAVLKARPLDFDLALSSA
ncbi:MAG: lysophospholipid acyltransferase family protein, partial [Acidimicrobiales bacterium]